MLSQKETTRRVWSKTETLIPLDVAWFYNSFKALDHSVAERNCWGITMPFTKCKSWLPKKASGITLTHYLIPGIEVFSRQNVSQLTHNAGSNGPWSKRSATFEQGQRTKAGSWMSVLSKVPCFSNSRSNKNTFRNVRSPIFLLVQNKRHRFNRTARCLVLPPRLSKSIQNWIWRQFHQEKKSGQKLIISQCVWGGKGLISWNRNGAWSSIEKRLLVTGLCIETAVGVLKTIERGLCRLGIIVACLTTIRAQQNRIWRVHQFKLKVVYRTPDFKTALKTGDLLVDETVTSSESVFLTP